MACLQYTLHSLGLLQESKDMRSCNLNLAEYAIWTVEEGLFICYMFRVLHLAVAIRACTATRWPRDGAVHLPSPFPPFSTPCHLPPPFPPPSPLPALSPLHSFPPPILPALSLPSPSTPSLPPSLPSPLHSLPYPPSLPKGGKGGRGGGKGGGEGGEGGWGEGALCSSMFLRVATSGGGRG